MTSTANREPAWYAARIACLREFMTEARYDLFRRTVANRTRYMTVLAENMYHGQNAAALIRHCEAFGVQRMHTVEALCRFEPNAASARGTEQWVDVVRHPSTADALAALKAELASVIDHAQDSVRFYRLGNNYQNRIDAMGRTGPIQTGEPMIL